MTLQQTLDSLKTNDDGKLFRKDRQVVFATSPDELWGIVSVYLDDEGTIVADLIRVNEDGVPVEPQVPPQ
jgi:hypothetical protein